MSNNESHGPAIDDAWVSIDDGTKKWVEVRALRELADRVARLEQERRPLPPYGRLRLDEVIRERDEAIQELGRLRESIFDAVRGFAFRDVGGDSRAYPIPDDEGLITAVKRLNFDRSSAQLELQRLSELTSGAVLIREPRLARALEDVVTEASHKVREERPHACPWSELVEMAAVALRAIAKMDAKERENA